MQHKHAAMDEIIQLEKIDTIISAVCEVGNIAYCNLVCAPKGNAMNLYRGICCVLSRDMGVHPSVTAKLLHRDRSNVINLATRYRNLMYVKDKQTISFYEKVLNLLKHE